MLTGKNFLLKEHINKTVWFRLNEERPDTICFNNKGKSDTDVVSHGN